MRISADINDEAFSPVAQHSKVYLDGVALRNCITADDSTGECICHKLNDNGIPYLIGDVLATETRTGSVRIEIPDDMKEFVCE